MGCVSAKPVADHSSSFPAPNCKSTGRNAPTTTDHYRNNKSRNSSSNRGGGSKSSNNNGHGPGGTRSYGEPGVGQESCEAEDEFDDRNQRTANLRGHFYDQESHVQVCRAMSDHSSSSAISVINDAFEPFKESRSSSQASTSPNRECDQVTDQQQQTAGKRLSSLFGGYKKAKKPTEEPASAAAKDGVKFPDDNNGSSSSPALHNGGILRRFGGAGRPQESLSPGLSHNGSVVANSGSQNKSKEKTTTDDSTRYPTPLTPEKLHKNFQERLFTAQLSRGNKLSDSQQDFFRMLDEKIAQGRDFEAQPMS